MTAKETKDIFEKYIKCANFPCPNDDDLSCAGCELFITENEWDEALKTVVKILEKQIPQKPIEEAYNAKTVSYNLRCPACGKIIGYRGMITGRIAQKYANKNFCGECGQKIDYGDD